MDMQETNFCELICLIITFNILALFAQMITILRSLPGEVCDIIIEVSHRTLLESV
jgi:hypothetical protein